MRTRLAMLALLVGLVPLSESFARQEERGQVKIRPVPDDPGRSLRIWVWTDRGDGGVYCPGDSIRIYFRTNIDAYVTIYDLNTRGRVSVLFPNRFHRDNFARGGRTYSLPADGGYHLEVVGPEGWEYLRAVASTRPRYHYRLGSRPPVWSRKWDQPEGQEKATTAEELDREIRQQIVVVPDEDARVDLAETSLYVEDWRRCWGHPWPRRGRPWSERPPSPPRPPHEDWR